tara:strand:+ start:102 stop:494 length:393 start_codon:yes stop_codon:yes gene_type:complete
MKIIIVLFLTILAPGIHAYDLVCSDMQGTSVTYDSRVIADDDGFSRDKFFLTFSPNFLEVKMSGLNTMKDTAILINESRDGWRSYIAIYPDVQRIWVFYPAKNVLSRTDIQTLIFSDIPETKVMMSKCID